MKFDNLLKFRVESTGDVLTNLDRIRLKKNYIHMQTLADKQIPSSDKKKAKFILQNGVISGGDRKKLIH